jgi:hypothetical protein
MRKSGEGSTGEPLGVQNCLVEPYPEAHSPQRIYIAKNLFRDRLEVPGRVLNATRLDQVMKGSTLAQCEPVTLVRHLMRDNRSEIIARNHRT